MANGKGNGKGRKFRPELWVDYGSAKKNGNGGGRRPKNKGPRRAPGPSRTYASNVLTQGCGALPPKPWGGRDTYSINAWDAKVPQHLPLPRAVGPYTVIRATKRVSSNAAASVIGAFMLSPTAPVGPGCWSTVCMMTSVNKDAFISAADNCNRHCMQLNLGSAATLVPSAITVQIMCPTALDTASGFIYAGTMNTQALIAGRAEKWAGYFERFIQYQAPRLLSAGKLVLRGIQVNSFPMNMSRVSEFTPTYQGVDGTITWNLSQEEPTGWAPILVYNPNNAVLEYLVTVEYRVRFDLENPAAASHTHHKVATDTTWNNMIKQATAMGHGVKDIADVIATAGTAVKAFQVAASMA
jgi:hypothetical protein